ncbi:YaaR family protein [Pseudalkalibacillus caeni]|uniref:DUF327 family protein n=1 Tax=Exobacillus caeni TaxID=2574798 RepID=A0A5R9F0Y0_9BACL|nr:YaaR family protein [Pseudalkalibacillus caeni]TLS36651.1 DUF327 family protein [Pseudalkalibacillus caeni]
MRIQNHMKNTVDLTKPEGKGNRQSANFSTALKQSTEKMKMDNLNRLLGDIEAQGQRLNKSKTFENLLAYKRMVKQFMEEALHGLELTEKHSFNGRGESRTFKLVEVIEQKLVDLQEEVLGKEQKGLDVLASVGEIKGLLVNLYM